MRTSKEQIERIKDLARELRRSTTIPMEAASASSAITDLEAELAESLEGSSLDEPQRAPSSPASASVRDAQPSSRPPTVTTPRRPPATKQAREVTEHALAPGLPESAENLLRSSIERQFEYISLGLAGLVEALWPFVEARYLREYGAEWLDVALERSRGPRNRRTPPRHDASFILGMLLNREVFEDLEYSTLRLIHESRDLRNAWAHKEGPLSIEDSYRAVDTFERLIKQFDLEIPGRLLKLRGEVRRELCSACEPLSPPEA